MYVLASNQIIKKFPYSVGDLLKDNPQTSFPSNPSNETLASFDVFPVVSTSIDVDSTHVATQDGCEYNVERQRWETTWVVRNKTADELVNEANENAKRIEAQRADAYRNESDSLFFKSQRGEVSVQIWLDKVAEIKARYPD